MTRQWLAPPEFMCDLHIRGEHAETHKFLEDMEKGKSLQGYRDGSMFFGAEYILHRHELLSKKISGHGSPLSITDKLTKQYPLTLPVYDDVKASVNELISRCVDCRRLFV